MKCPCIHVTIYTPDWCLSVDYYEFYNNVFSKNFIPVMYNKTDHSKCTAITDIVFTVDAFSNVTFWKTLCYGIHLQILAMEIAINNDMIELFYWSEKQQILLRVKNTYIPVVEWWRNLEIPVGLIVGSSDLHIYWFLFIWWIM